MDTTLFALTVLLSWAPSPCRAGSGPSSPPASWSVPFAQPGYQRLSAASKLSQLMAKLEGSKGASGRFPGGSDLLGIFSDKTSMETSLEFESDQLPTGRLKYIHSVGAVARVAFRPASGTKYTGIFAGADTGLIRMSSALDQDKSAEYDPKARTGKALAPGFGLKFLRDGIKSCNLVAMYSVDGQASHNFFANSFTTQIGDPKGVPVQVLAQKFATAKSSGGWVGKVGLSDFAKAGQDGQTLSAPQFPFYLEFVPTDEVSGLFSDAYSGTYYADQLASLKSGTALYQVRAIDKPGEQAHLIGSLVMTSDMFKSSWGDQHLFFQHQAWPEDTELKPHWLDKDALAHWGDHFVNGAASPLQTKPVVASIFASPVYNAAFKAAATAANLAKPNLPRTLAEAKSSCPFAERLLQRHEAQRAELDKSLEKSLAQCSVAHSSQAEEEQWKEAA